MTVYEDDGGLVLSPTDLTKHLACRHLTTLDLLALRGGISPPLQVDEALELIFRLGPVSYTHLDVYKRQAWG